MPKHLKDTRIEYWKDKEPTQNDEGVIVPGGPYKVADLWANFKGKDYSEFYQIHAYWAKPIFQATFTRPGFAVEVGDHIKCDGLFYEVKSIDDLTGKPHSDVKVTVEYDERYSA